MDLILLRSLRLKIVFKVSYWILAKRRNSTLPPVWLLIRSFCFRTTSSNYTRVDKTGLPIRITGQCFVQGCRRGHQRQKKCIHRSQGQISNTLLHRRSKQPSTGPGLSSHPRRTLVWNLRRLVPSQRDALSRVLPICNISDLARANATNIGNHRNLSY